MKRKKSVTERNQIIAFYGDKRKALKWDFWVAVVPKLTPNEGTGDNEQPIHHQHNSQARLWPHQTREFVQVLFQQQQMAGWAELLQTAK